MILGQIESIQVGRPRRYDGEGDSAKPWTSAIRKQTVVGNFKGGITNIMGDEQAALKHHGGPGKAVLAYSAKQYDDWKREFHGISLQAGGFGENLIISGYNEAKCCIGDIVRIGDCRLQISQPRQPCWELSRLWKLPKLAVLVQQTGRTGWYYRALQEGIIKAGLPIDLIELRQAQHAARTEPLKSRKNPENLRPGTGARFGRMSRNASESARTARFRFASKNDREVS